MSGVFIWLLNTGLVGLWGAEKEHEHTERNRDCQELLAQTAFELMIARFSVTCVFFYLSGFSTRCFCITNFLR